jgi:hypothetical protein
MSFKNILRSLSLNVKKDDHQKPSQMLPVAAPAPEFTFIRSDTYTKEVIHPPSGNSFHDTPHNVPVPSRPRSSSTATTRSRFRHSFHHIPVISSNRRDRSSVSINIPQDLPQVNDADPDREAQWEKRATVLVGNPIDSSFPATQSASFVVHDENIQEAIRLHEAGEYERSTAMFGRLADPQGPNNALSQVLYGLALRHGWGIDTDPEKAVMYLQSAAKNSAAVEEEALRAGMKKGGKAKGELVLAIYEVSNRHHTFCAAPLQSKSGIYTIHTHVFLMP